jgi:putative two-component system response regulator
MMIVVRAMVYRGNCMSALADRGVIPFSVLIVDDEAPQRMLEGTALREAGFAVDEATNGREAIERVESKDYDVVLMDKRMPIMDGDKACHYIRHELGKSLLPIIMVTGSRSEQELVRSLDNGASDFVCKPYSLTELVARVTSAANTKRSTDQLDSADSLLFALARMVEAKDNNTGDHCSRLQHLAEVFGRKLGLSNEELIALKRGGVLHDIGKLGIPDSILLKNAELTDAEWAVMRQHPIIGEALCSGLSSMRSTLPIIRCHHERWDGGGYPDGLRGKEIPYLARVFQILDIYDALSNARPYKDAFSKERVIEIMEEESAKGWRDPKLSALFIEIIKNDEESLALPLDFKEDLGTQIYNDIVANGVDHDDRSAA